MSSTRFKHDKCVDDPPLHLPGWANALQATRPHGHPGALEVTLDKHHGPSGFILW